MAFAVLLAPTESTRRAGPRALSGARFAASAGLTGGHATTSGHGRIAYMTPERTIPSFLILAFNVVRFIPSRIAAPCGPPMTQFDFIKTARMCARSIASS
jgi:hypothetical protein